MPTVQQTESYLECPCCGDDGAESDEQGLFADGDSLICGCNGWVSVDRETDPYITLGDEPCPLYALCRDPFRDAVRGKDL